MKTMTRYWLTFRMAAVVLFSTAALLAAAPAGQSEADKHFAAALAYIDDPTGPKYEEAYREFHAAYAISPANETLSNIGYCALNLERDAEAIDAYKRFLRSPNAGTMNARQRKQMESDVQMLSASLVTVSLQTTPPNVTLVDERFPAKGPTIVNRYTISAGQDIGIHPGNHKITVTAAGFEPQSWEFEAQPASKHMREFRLSPIPSATSPSHGAAAASPAPATAAPQIQRSGTTTTNLPEKGTSDSVYIGVAATGVFAVGATVTGILAVSKKGDYEDANRDGLRPDDARTLRDDAKRYALFSDVFLGATVVSAGIAAYLYFSEPTKKQEGPPKSARWDVSPSVGRNQAAVVISGKY